MLVAVAALAVMGCQPMEPEVAPDPVAEIMALIGTAYDSESSEDRLRAALDLPPDYPIQGAVVSGPFAAVWADNDPPRCSVRDGDTAEEVAEFITCFARARADTGCTVRVTFLLEPDGNGGVNIVGMEIHCAEDPKF